MYSLLGDRKYCQQSVKVGRPKTRHLWSPESANVENEDTSLVGRTGSHPSIAENPAVPQPGFDPDVMSLMPLASRALLYNQGFKRPSGGLFFASR